MIKINQIVDERLTPRENQHDIGKSAFLIGATSSNGCFSIVNLLVFGGVRFVIYYERQIFLWGPSPSPDDARQLPSLKRTSCST